jgi:hypothetical protein
MFSSLAHKLHALGIHDPHWQTQGSVTQYVRNDPRLGFGGGSPQLTVSFKVTVATLGSCLPKNQLNLPGLAHIFFGAIRAGFIGYLPHFLGARRFGLS